MPIKNEFNKVINLDKYRCFIYWELSPIKWGMNVPYFANDQQKYRVFWIRVIGATNLSSD